MVNQDQTNQIKKIWLEVTSRNKIWERIKIRGEAFYFQKKSNELIKLSSFSKDDLQSATTEFLDLIYPGQDSVSYCGMFVRILAGVSQLVFIC